MTRINRISVRCGFCKQRFMSELSRPRTIALHAETCDKIKAWMEKRAPLWYAYDFRLGNHENIRVALMAQVETRTALRFATLAEAESTYSQWAESRCYGNYVQLIDHRRPKNWLLKSSVE